MDNLGYFGLYYYLRHRHYDIVIEESNKLLLKNPLDQIAWYSKARALAAKSYIADEDLQDDNLADGLLEESAMASVPRPGTSLRTANGKGGINQSIRPLTQSGRPMTGFLRPGTMAQGGTKDISRGFTAAVRSGTAMARGTTGVGRLNTASLITEPDGPFIQIDKLDLKKYAARPLLSRVLFDYIFYQQNNPKKALELASHATVFHEYQDWWWKAQLGKCFYRLGMFRDAERQWKSSIKDHETIATLLELGKIYMKLDQPKTAIDLYTMGLRKFPGSAALLTGIARTYELMNNLPESSKYYKLVLYYENANIEGLASLAGHCFYSDQPEVALIYYRRLLQMGLDTAEIWTNIGLCCFYGHQYDLMYNAFTRALARTSSVPDSEGTVQVVDETSTLAFIYYNLGHVAVSIGDMSLAMQCWKISASAASTAASGSSNLNSVIAGMVREESETNLRVLESRKGKVSQQALSVTGNLFETYYNAALSSFRMGNFPSAFNFCQKSLEIYPEFEDGKVLLEKVKEYYTHR